MKYGNYRDGFFLPNELFQLGLGLWRAGGVQFPETVRKSKDASVLAQHQNHRRSSGHEWKILSRKYIRQLEERGLITTEPTEVITKSSGRRNGNLLFTLRPIGEVIDQHYDRQTGGIGVSHRTPASGETPAGAGKPNVTACGPLCAPIAGGAESLPLPSDRGRILGRCSRSLERELSPSWALLRRTKRKAGETTA